jgi:hypothetical protein
MPPPAALDSVVSRGMGAAARNGPRDNHVRAGPAYGKA